MTSAIHRWRHRLRESADNYGLVLLLTVLAIGAQALPPSLPGAMPIILVTLCASILTSLHSSRVRQQLQALALVVVVLTLAVIFLGDRAPPAMTSAVLFVLSLLLFVCPIAILIRISRHKRVTSRTLFGAVVVYLQLAMSFTILYLVIDRISDNAIAGATPGDIMDYTYFSFVTITTLGYGDYAPVSNSARLLAIGEAVIGQIFLVTIVARLVSLLGTSTSDIDTDIDRLRERLEEGRIDPEEMPETAGE